MDYNKKVLTFDEACKYCGYSESYLHQLVKRKIIPGSKPNNGAIFFEREKLEEWLLSNPTTTFQNPQNAVSPIAASH